MKKIGIILINYKDYAQRFLADARDSLRTQTYPHDRYTVYIIDNVSTPHTLAQLHNIYPEATIIPTQGNGWGHANNIGMKAAWQDACDAAVLANMDTVFESRWLEELVSGAYSEESIGIAQSKILLWDSKKINSIGNKFHFLGFSYCDGYNQDDHVLDDHVKDIDTASGAAMLIKKDVALHIGGCDETYFMYHDDLELSLKAKLAGYRIVLIPRSIMYHKYEFSRSINQVYYMERNRYLTIFIFFKWPTLILIAPALAIMDTGLWLYAFKGKWLDAKWRANAYFFKPSTWRHIIKRRAEIKKLRTISDRQLLRNASGKVIFQEIDNPLLRYIGNPLMNAYWHIAKRCIVW